MTAAEYQKIQRCLSALLARDRMRLKRLSGKRAEGYEEAVLAAKSEQRRQSKAGRLRPGIL